MLRQNSSRAMRNQLEGQPRSPECGQAFLRGTPASGTSSAHEEPVLQERNKFRSTSQIWSLPPRTSAVNLFSALLCLGSYDDANDSILVRVRGDPRDRLAGREDRVGQAVFERPVDLHLLGVLVELAGADLDVARHHQLRLRRRSVSLLLR